MLFGKFGIGVVEDRNDPKEMGRVRVRVLGVHSPDRVNDVPINSLPWSIVMMPANTSSSAGAIAQLMEGTWVMVVFVDDNLQDPIVVGSLPATLGGLSPNYNKGFTDPFGRYPRVSYGDSDTTLIGRSTEWQQHPVYTDRARKQIKDIPIAKSYEMTTVSDDVPEEERSTVSENNLRGGQTSIYPYNDVKEYENGYIEEYDASPGATRVTKTHPAGTYEEILIDGTKTVKIVGDGYDITLGNHTMYVKGDLNVTVEGSMRQLVKGDYILEVGGAYRQTVVGDRTAKLSANDLVEISNDQSINIKANYNLKANNTTQIFTVDFKQNIGNDANISISNDHTLFVANNSAITVGNDKNEAVLNNLKITTGGTYTTESVGNILLDTDANLNSVVTGNINETVSGSQTTTVTGAIDINGATIDLN